MDTAERSRPKSCGKRRDGARRGDVQKIRCAAGNKEEILGWLGEKVRFDCYLSTHGQFRPRQAMGDTRGGVAGARAEEMVVVDMAVT